MQLNHLKRVRRSKDLNDKSVLEVLICPVSTVESVSDDVMINFPKRRVASVCRYPPHTRKEFEIWGSSWPTLFRPNDLDKDREKGFQIDDIDMIEGYIKTLMEDIIHIQNFQPSISSGGIIVNPLNKKVSDKLYNVSSINFSQYYR